MPKRTTTHISTTGYMINTPIVPISIGTNELGNQTDLPHRHLQKLDSSSRSNVDDISVLRDSDSGELIESLDCWGDPNNFDITRRASCCGILRNIVSSLASVPVQRLSAPFVPAPSCPVSPLVDCRWCRRDCLGCACWRICNSDTCHSCP